VILDEAIQLARRFGGESSPGFVNGVLDAVAKQVGKQTEPDVKGGRESGRGVG
jgi:transcription termination factor NusB